ncbi:MAG: hypothetical protein IT169_20005 [Bryobacterales bacterium]|nr:hypothetical protein [Bryobacterales bacterium]
MKSTNPNPIEFTKRANEHAREQRQTDFLRHLAQGESIADACVLVGVTGWCYEKWRNRSKDFRDAVQSARESHRRGILSGFHTADAYARMLLDAIQRDESLPAALRYRASKSLLSRKGKADWLPEPIPADAAPLAPFEDVEDEQPEASPHAESAPAPPQSHNESSGQAIPNPKPAGPIIVNATASAVNERIPSDSLIPAYGSNPENPDKTPHPQFAANSLEHQQDPPMPPASGRPAEFFNNPEIPHPAPPAEIHADSHPAVHENERLSAANAAAPAASTAPSDPSPATTLSQTWLSAHFLHGHESPKAFEALLNNHIHAYAPATPAEELLIFRITQKAWLLRRLETWERVIADSRVADVRQKHPNAAAPACIALSLLEAKETSQTRFYERTAKLRQEHEAALDRLTSKLEIQQLRRQAAQLRAQRENPPCPTSRPRLSFAHIRASMQHAPGELTSEERIYKAV